MTQFVFGQRPIHRLDIGSASVGVVTVAAKDGNGTTIPMGTVTDNANGTYDVQPVSAYAAPTIVEITWTGTGFSVVTRDEIVGSLLFTLEEARAYRTSGLSTPLSSTSDYPDGLLMSLREQVAESFETRKGRSYVRRYCRGQFVGGGGRLLTPAAAWTVTSTGENISGAGRFRDIRSVISVTVDGSTVSTSNVQVTPSGFYRKDATWPANTSDPYNITIEWEYGVEQAEARRHGLATLANRAVRSDISPFSSSFSGGGESQTFSAGGWAWPPEVWDWLKHSYHVGIA